MTKKKSKLSFDGKGINDKSTAYCDRIATFTSHERGQMFGPLFEAAPEMLETLRRIVQSAPITGLPLALEKDIQDASQIVSRIREASRELCDWDGCEGEVLQDGQCAYHFHLEPSEEDQEQDRYARAHDLLKGRQQDGD